MVVSSNVLADVALAGVITAAIYANTYRTNNARVTVYGLLASFILYVGLVFIGASMYTLGCRAISTFLGHRRLFVGVGLK